MVASTEQNSRGNGPSSGEAPKSIVIKLPFDLQERLLCFPFLHALHQDFPTAELHFITPKQNIEVLNLLPFKAYYHEFDEDEIENIFDVHRYTANAKINKVDLFISLTNSFVDACLGLGLRATERLGFSDNWKTLVLNIKTTRPINHHICEDFLGLYKLYFGHEVDSKLKVISRDLEPIIEEWEERPYIALNLSPLRRAAIESEWLQLLNEFEDKRIILFASEDQEQVQLLLESFWPRLPKQNEYVNFVHKSWIELAKMLAYARGTITYNGALASLSAYVGTKTLILYDLEDPQRFGPFYFMAEVAVMSTTDPACTNSHNKEQLLQERKTFDMTKVYSKALEFFGPFPKE